MTSAGWLESKEVSKYISHGIPSTNWERIEVKFKWCSDICLMKETVQIQPKYETYPKNFSNLKKSYI